MPVIFPTPDEWLWYCVKRLKEDGRKDLLRRYLMDETTFLVNAVVSGFNTPDLVYSEEGSMELSF